MIASNSFPILIAVASADARDWLAQFQAQAPERDFRFWPDAVGDASDIACVCVWKTAPGLLAPFPNLKAIFNLGAGVDGCCAIPICPTYRSCAPCILI